MAACLPVIESNSGRSDGCASRVGERPRVTNEFTALESQLGNQLIV